MLVLSPPPTHPDCPQKGLFNNLLNVILTSSTAVSKMINDDNDNFRNC